MHTVSSLSCDFYCKTENCLLKTRFIVKEYSPLCNKSSQIVDLVSCILLPIERGCQGPGGAVSLYADKFPFIFHFYVQASFYISFSV